VNDNTTAELSLAHGALSSHAASHLTSPSSQPHAVSSDTLADEPGAHQAPVEASTLWHPVSLAPVFAYLDHVDDLYFQQVNASAWAPGTVMHMLASAADVVVVATTHHVDPALLVLTLESAAVERARDRGLVLCYTTCTSNVTAFISEHELGFTPRVACKISDFVHDGVAPFTDIAAEEDSVVLLDKKLKREVAR
jgi:hypothetical protein